ncbi:MAG: hypothetical protein LQ338_005861 [Usnochroma carphineum]|nr:MAG: hypothetical protein LQ338_005861 [Usnochroma carphineum]
MRWMLRFALPAVIIVITLCIVLYIKFAEIWGQYNAPAYAWASLQNTLRGSKLDNPPPVPGKVEDKVVIMAKVESEDTQWVADHLPDWQHAIYIVNPSSLALSNGTLTTPLNKGHESMAYLTYIIDHYNSLPSTLAFIHPHRRGFSEAWHTDTPLHDNADALRSLRVPYVQGNGYANLRCNWNPGCEMPHRKNKHITPGIWREVFAGASQSVFSLKGKGVREEEYVPKEVGVACCAQFAVSRERVLQRPLSDYEGFRKWVVDTELSDARSGRVMEFLWHVIFGMDAV